MSATATSETALGQAAISPGTMTTRRWMSVMLLAMTTLVLIGGAVGAVALTRTAAASNRLSDRIAPARTAVVRWECALLDQETAVCGYVLTGDARFLEPYEEGVRAERETLARLRDLLTTEPDILRQVDRSSAQAEQWRSGSAATLIRDRRAGATPGALTVAVDRGEVTFDDARAQISALDDRLDQIHTTGRQGLDRSRDLRDLSLLAVLATLLACVIVVFLLVRVAVLRPLEQLGAAVRRVAGGDFDHRLRPAGPADVARLTTDVESMRRRVVDALVSSQRDRETLEQQADELRRSNEDLEQFAYVASHDLQEPLRKVSSFCQMLQRRYGAQLDERARQYTAYAVDGATRMQELIDDLLAFSRIGRTDGELREVDLAEILDRAESNLSGPIIDADATVTADPMPRVLGDPTLLTMLWQNLIGNAVKFRRPDQPPRIRIGVAESPEGWAFTATDNGIGIDPQYAERIFLIFHRLHPRGVYPGTGIGLAICRKIVEYHGGTLWLDESWTEGTRFCFTLPAIPGQSGEPTTDPVAGA